MLVVAAVVRWGVAAVKSKPLGFRAKLTVVAPTLLAAGVALLASSGSARADVIDLTFEGVNATYPSSGFAFVQNFYNGGTSSDGTSGPNFGIGFSSNAQALCLNTPFVTCSNTSRGGLGDPASQLGGLFFLSGAETFKTWRLASILDSRSTTPL
jgi:hypothetical protein